MLLGAGGEVYEHCLVLAVRRMSTASMIESGWHGSL
jgi:hypothetical protein